MKRRLCIFMAVALIILFTGCSTVPQSAAYDNPIDAYFLPLIAGAEAEVVRRDYQDTYGGVWQSEYENILAWMKEKCVYQYDIDMLDQYDAAIQSLIDVTRTVLVPDWLGDYELRPDSPDRYLWGNGTRSALNQQQGEIYRDSGMRLIGYYDDYKFLERDYTVSQYGGIQSWNKPASLQE